MEPKEKITVLKDGFLLHIQNIKDPSDRIYRDYLLVFNSQSNHNLISRIAEYTKGKPFDETRKCPADWLIKNYYENSLNKFKVILRSCIEDPQRKDRSFGSRALFSIYPVIRGRKDFSIDTISVRKAFYFDIFIHREEWNDRSKRKLKFWLEDFKRTAIEFELEKSVKKYGKNWPKWIENEAYGEEDESIIVNRSEQAYFPDPSYKYSENLRDILPPLPQHEIIGRGRDIKIVTEALNKFHSTNEYGLRPKIFFIHGLPGVGKTTLSIVLSHNNTIQSLFQDGIIWLSLGKNPDFKKHIDKLGIAFDSDELRYVTSFEVAEQVLQSLLRNGKFLLIIDDVWDLSDADPFIRLSKNTPTIFTTRLPKLAYSLNLNDEDIYKLEILSDTDSIKLLHELAPSVVSEYEDECRKLVNLLDGLPLAIRVAGYLLRKQAIYNLSISKLLSEIMKGKLILQEKPPYEMENLTSESSATVAALLKRSTDFLSPTAKRCFSMLSYFPSKPADFGFDDLEGIWQVENLESIVKELFDFGLIEKSQEKGKFQLHYLMMLLAEALRKEITRSV